MNIHMIKRLREYDYLASPIFIQISLTDRCPLSCPQCYKDLNNQNEFNYEKLEELLINAKQIGVKQIIFIGGEPLIYSRIQDLFKLAGFLKLQQFYSTSGIGIQEFNPLIMKNNNVHISLSLNGSCEDVHSLSRDGFQITISAMEWLHTNNIEFSINWVLRHDNIDDLQNVVNMARHYDAQYINVIKNKLTSKNSIDSPIIYNDLEKFKKVYLHNHDIIKIENCFTELKNILGYESKIFFRQGCGAGKIFCAVATNGDFMPCTHLNYYEKHSDIQSYWDKSLVISKLRTLKPLTTCEKCIYESTCNPCRASTRNLNDIFNDYNYDCILYKRREEI